MKHQNLQHGFLTAIPSDQRLSIERERRLANSIEMRFGHPYLDDALVGIAKNDLILIGADTGTGKTEFCTNLAIANLHLGRNVSYLALEAHECEIEQRILYRTLSLAMERSGRRPPRYKEWACGDKGGISDGDYATMIRHARESLKNFAVFYRERDFGIEQLKKLINNEADTVDMIIIDHLHFIDSPDDNDNRALKELTKTIRDISIVEGLPIVLVSHLRKRNSTHAAAPTIDDFHGSSDVVKISTVAIMMSLANSVDAQGMNESPTFFQIVKDRWEGAKRYHALSVYDRNKREYSPTYSLGFEAKDGKSWTPIQEERRPSWARRHKTV